VKYGKLNHKNIKRISTPAIDMLMAYHWPGNVRELENCIERAVLVSDDDVIHGHHLPPSLQTAEASHTALVGTLEIALDNLERELIVDALKSARGNAAKAARSLGLTERSWVCASESMASKPIVSAASGSRSRKAAAIQDGCRLNS